ncbi:MAG: DUF1887 family protein [Lachnospiraceae bacterium]|nr:DUF1887 family protein [Lachnospiraceae bacterium]
MVVNFEFLGMESVENVITCMHFKVDKVVYFGYPEMVSAKKKRTERFLRKRCGVREVVFHSMPRGDLQAMLKIMQEAMDAERNHGNEMFFDITGGENLILVAFGMLAGEYDTPMHQFDVREDRLIELDEGSKRRIGRDVPRQNVTFTLDTFIELKGGVVNHSLHKDLKAIGNKDFSCDVDSIWQVAKRNWNYWNSFSAFLGRYMVSEDSLQVDVSVEEVQKALGASKSSLRKLSDLNRLVDELAKAGILKQVNHAGARYRFAFKNGTIKSCLMDAGSILELYTYKKEKEHSDDCRVGVHLDWDGVVQSRGMDVLNEIDVLTMDGNVPTFISCKGGRLDSHQALHALYELETVTRRFGGKYAKKVLVTARPLGRTYMERAEELRIEVRCEVKKQ